MTTIEQLATYGHRAVPYDQGKLMVFEEYSYTMGDGREITGRRPVVVPDCPSWITHRYG